MKFGKVDSIKGIDFSLPKDHLSTAQIIQSFSYKGETSIYVGCAKWNRQDLKNFYPRGTKDELTYYAKQFNAIEMNASFYRIFPKAQFETWAEKVPENFRFFPKLYQGISHWKRLKDAESYVEENINAILRLEDKLEMPFLQLHDNFAPKPENIAPLENFIQNVWPKNFPLAIELRHTDWFNNKSIAENLYRLLEENQITNIITDTAGRRDLLHMRLTTNSAFIRYVGSNHGEIDYQRAEEWVRRIKEWVDLGIEKIYFFVHQNEEVESVRIAKFFIKKLNVALGTHIQPPVLKDEIEGKLF